MITHIINIFLLTLVSGILIFFGKTVRQKTRKRTLFEELRVRHRKKAKRSRGSI